MNRKLYFCICVFYICLFGPAGRRKVFLQIIYTYIFKVRLVIAGIGKHGSEEIPKREDTIRKLFKLSSLGV